jgi:hypothetical protein
LDGAIQLGLSSCAPEWFRSQQDFFFETLSLPNRPAILRPISFKDAAIAEQFTSIAT